MKQILKELGEQQNVRSNLSNLRQVMKEKEQMQEVISWIELHEEQMFSYLHNEDAKTRKNAALLLGDASYQNAVSALWNAYNNEGTLFVKSAYLVALLNLDAKEYLSEFHKRLEDLLNFEVKEENKKHINEEIRALRTLVIRYEGITHHTFCQKREEDVLLTTNRMHREIVRRSLADTSAQIHPLGVMIKTKQISTLWNIRSFREILFPLPTNPTLIEAKPVEVSMALIAAGIIEKLEECHKENLPFYFRIEYKSKKTLEERSLFTKKTAELLEQMSEGKLINSTSDYEIEIRFVENKDGKLFTCLKFFTLMDHRFDYRKNYISASIHPATAALLMEIAKPYLKENAQIIDPFCGVGTMLIERTMLVPAKEMYATDIFGEAIEKGRENALAAKVRINFIHRDFFDFKHEYLFDEIITNMPMRGKKTREEMDTLYRDFFQKVLEIAQDKATIIMYTNEIGLVKKQLRLKRQFKLLQETCIQDKTDFYLLVIGVER